MDHMSLEEKQQQFQEFFSIRHQVKVNLIPLEKHALLPDVDSMEAMMPYAFRISSDISELEGKALRPLRLLGYTAGELATFLNLQSKKIDLLMSYVLQEQDEEQHRYPGISFGGGGVTITSPEPMETGLQAELKIFINEEACAIFCFGEVITCKQEDDLYHISLIFNRIREQDQEILVRASLHLQTRQLKKRAQKEKP